MQKKEKRKLNWIYWVSGIGLTLYFLLSFSLIEGLGVLLGWIIVGFIIKYLGFPKHLLQNEKTI